ncbi:MAG: phage tail sheath family protein [Chitinophaga sp.]|uniref:phage tail sheath family protein n=1 Tax=Chitinophaga sp. TaxID=1869181 RepID=UPI001B15A0EA|nr:phage tail sheath C-terminal domain-containing protein [Chitinophaga sp.]MBO9731384.1 phage tail sheath family protein [Chitinophaga sp.]
MAALLDLRMPGVYTQEISTLPPTVGVVPSAVPVFIGNTQKADKKGVDLSGKPTRIKSMKEYEDLFGTAPLQKLKVTIDESTGTPDVQVADPTDFKYKMYHSLLFYFANGGGPCYILSVGKFDTDPDANAIKTAIGSLTKVQEVTILVFPDGTSLTEEQYQSGVITTALQHCSKMKDRVTIIDLHSANGDSIDTIESGFQTRMPSDIEFKKYGMTYYPYIKTIFSYNYAEADVAVTSHVQSIPGDANTVADLKAKAKAYLDANAAIPAAQGKVDGLTAEKKALTYLKTALDAWVQATPGAKDADMLVQLLKISADSGVAIPADVATELDKANPAPQTILGKAQTDTDTALGLATTALTNAQGLVASTLATLKAAVKALGSGVSIPLTNFTMDVIKDVNNLIYGKIKDAISNLAVTLPPCGAIAGIYVRTDATAGVWQAPANVSVFGGIKPALDIDDDLHANLNAPSNGKAINAIRTYPGRGLLVYGARTLAGNDLEWRYVNVRRTFCFIEDSIALAMQDFVFAPNNEQTWIKVRAMIRSFLNRLWKAGGLYGNTPDDAYAVICSAPESMSDDDVLNGIMRIFVKVAVARPAEFIVLQYEHKFELAES